MWPCFLFAMPGKNSGRSKIHASPQDWHCTIDTVLTSTDSPYAYFSGGIRAFLKGDLR